jgi:exonuclease III
MTAHPANTSRGGSAIIIKKEISHIMENKYETDKIQSTAVKIRTKKQNITISAAYCPTGKNLKQENYQEFFATLGERFIPGGDYNAKNTQWGSRLTTTKGRELMKAINSINGNIHTTGRHTYWPTDRNKISDVIRLLHKQKSSNALHENRGFLRS